MKPLDVYNYIKVHLNSGAYDAHGSSEVSMVCPGCGDDGHFSININKMKYNCYKCSIGGNLAQTVIKRRSEWRKLTQSLATTKDLVSGGNKGKIFFPKNAFNVYKSLYPDFAEPQKKHITNSLSLCERAFKYCRGRGLSKEQIRDYGIYVCPGDPRVYFPYWNGGGEITYYMGRKMMGSIDVMKTKDAFEAEKPLFGRHVKVLRKMAVLLEGVFDHFVTPMSYALMGSSIGTEQMLQLREDGVEKIFVIGDPDASEQADRIAKKLGNFRFQAFPVFLHSTSDPGELGVKIMTEIVETLLDRDDKVYKPIHVNVRQ